MKAFDFFGRLLPYLFLKTNHFCHSLSFSNGNLNLNPDCASCHISKNSPAMKTKNYYSWHYPLGKMPGVLTMNWSSETISYLIFIPRHNYLFFWNDGFLGHTRIVLRYASNMKSSTLCNWGVWGLFEISKYGRLNKITNSNPNPVRWIFLPHHFLNYMHTCSKLPIPKKQLLLCVR